MLKEEEKKELKKNAERIASLTGSLSIASQADVQAMMRVEEKLAVALEDNFNYIVKIVLKRIPVQGEIG